MANTTFNSPVRSENSFKNVIKNATTGAISNEMTLSTYVATITIANGATTEKESSIGIPSNFIPMGVMVAVTPSTHNNVTLDDIGTDADTDGFVDGATGITLNATGFKGFIHVMVCWVCLVDNHCLLQPPQMRLKLWFLVIQALIQL